MDDMVRDGKDIHQQNPAEELNFHGLINDTKSKEFGANYGYPHCFPAWEPSLIANPNIKVGTQFHERVLRQRHQRRQRRVVHARAISAAQRLFVAPGAARHQVPQRWQRRLHHHARQLVSLDFNLSFFILLSELASN